MRFPAIIVLLSIPSFFPLKIDSTTCQIVQTTTFNTNISFISLHHRPYHTSLISSLLLLFPPPLVFYHSLHISPSHTCRSLTRPLRSPFRPSISTNLLSFSLSLRVRPPLPSLSSPPLTSRSQSPLFPLEPQRIIQNKKRRTALLLPSDWLPHSSRPIIRQVHISLLSFKCSFLVFHF